MLPALIGGAMGVIGQMGANQANAGEGLAQRQWQEAMSNSAVQRSAKDMEAAGLNRILALGNPASTPSGGMPTHENVMGGLASSVRDAIQFKMQKEKQAEEIQVLKAQKLATQAAAGKSMAETALLENEQPAARVKGSMWQKLENSMKSGAEKWQQRSDNQNKEIKNLKLQLFKKN